MAVLTKERRAGLSKSTFAVPEDRAYPMPDKTHAIVAIGLAKMHHSPDLGRIKTAAKRKFGVGGKKQFGSLGGRHA